MILLGAARLLESWPFRWRISQLQERLWERFCHMVWVAAEVLCDTGCCVSAIFAGCPVLRRF